MPNVNFDLNKTASFSQKVGFSWFCEKETDRRVYFLNKYDAHRETCKSCSSSKSIGLLFQMSMDTDGCSSLKPILQ